MKLKDSNRNNFDPQTYTPTPRITCIINLISNGISIKPIAYTIAHIVNDSNKEGKMRS